MKLLITEASNPTPGLEGFVDSTTPRGVDFEVIGSDAPAGQSPLSSAQGSSLILFLGSLMCAAAE